MKQKDKHENRRINPVMLVAGLAIAVIALPILLRVAGMILGLTFGAFGLVMGLVFGLAGIIVGLLFATIWLWLPALVLLKLSRAGQRSGANQTADRLPKVKRTATREETRLYDENGDEFFYDDSWRHDKRRPNDVHQV